MLHSRLQSVIAQHRREEEASRRRALVRQERPTHHTLCAWLCPVTSRNPFDCWDGIIPNYSTLGSIGYGLVVACLHIHERDSPRGASQVDDCIDCAIAWLCDRVLVFSLYILCDILTVRCTEGRILSGCVGKDEVSNCSYSRREYTWLGSIDLQSLHA